MHGQSCQSNGPLRPKTPKSNGNNVFRIPSPSTFITTQSLTRIPPHKKKHRTQSSDSNASKGGSLQMACHFSTPRRTDGKNKWPLAHDSSIATNASLPHHGHSKAIHPMSMTNVGIPADNREEVVNKTSYGHDRLPTTQDAHRVNRAQVYLPGDQIIFAESPSVPGIPIVFRTEEERQGDPDKLNLDRRKLAICPILEGEDNLRLLNYQHNCIRKIEHLSMLTKLIFLDLYDNEIEEMSGLSSLKLLRVLMLGKNKLHSISNLNELIMLDVLDLHGNKITKVENVNHLKHLRVLNLAGNDLTIVENLVGLMSLSELNLRRNYIHVVHDIDELPCLQRLFLSFNDITNFNDIICVSKSLSLTELSLDGNPLSKCSDYKQLTIQSISNLRQLDMKRLTDEEKRFACIVAKRDEDKRREQERLLAMKEKRRIAINNAERQWNQQLGRGINDSCLPSLNMDGNENLETKSHIQSPRESFSVEQYPLKVVDTVKSLSTSHLAEVDDNCLNLYGHGSLEALDKDWGEKTHSSINAVNFKFINFQDVRPYLNKLCLNFPIVNSLNFDMTNITSFNELNMFSLFHHLDNLQITAAGNFVTRLSLWESYAIHHLSHLQLKTLNCREIRHSDLLDAKNIFGSTSQILPYKLPNYRKTMLKSTYRRLAVHHLINVIPLWIDHPQTAGQKVDAGKRKYFSTSFVSEILQNVILGDQKIQMLNECWNECLLDMVSSCVNEIIDDIDIFCNKVLEKIRGSIKTSI